MPSKEPSPWWDAERHADRRPFLLARGRIKATLRRWFEDEGFLEVDTAILQTSPGTELHLQAFATTLVGPDGSAAPFFLHTSPEFACKKLLAAGEKRLFTFAPVFRNRERSALHHPEFTMLEWYRANAPYEHVIADCAALVALAAETTGVRFMSWREAAMDPALAPEIVAVAEAFACFAGIDLLATVRPDGSDRDDLARRALRAGIRVAPDDTWADIFSRILTERVEPNLGIGRATVLTEYPVGEAALARPHPSDPRVAERFELYACGVELANGFGELTEPAEQRRRFERDMDEKERVYGERYPIDEDFLAALAHMPPASGVALGFDRLVMLATGATHIEQVLWTPVPKPGK
jgi:lysyl-tRNA synthetase class 2